MADPRNGEGGKGGELLRLLMEKHKPCDRDLRQLFALEPWDRTESQTLPAKQYDAPFARAVAAVLAGKPRPRREELIRVERGLELVRSNALGVFGLTDEQVEEMRGVPLVEVLLQLSFEERFRNRARMLNLAILAEQAVRSLDPRIYDPEVIADYQARALGELGNACRANDKLTEAESYLDAAVERFRQGSGNLLLLARLADLQSSFYHAQHRLQDACDLLTGVHQIYLKLGDEHLAGRALVKQGIFTVYGADDPTRALQLLRQGMRLLDRERDPEVVALAHQALLEAVLNCGDFREAARIFLESGLRQALAGQPLELIWLCWMEGRMRAGLGQLDRAESALQEARNKLLSQDRSYDAVVVGAELVAVWLEQSKSAQAEALASEMFATFLRLSMKREALRAVYCLVQACRRRQATPRIARFVGRFLQRLEREPQLRFEKP